MNKETRQFIFGIIVTISCLVGLVFGLCDLHNSLTLRDFVFNFLFCMLEFIGIVTGAYFILANI